MSTKRRAAGAVRDKIIITGIAGRLGRLLASSFFWKQQSCETVILRPVHILGGVRNAPSNYLRLPWVPTLLGFDPMVQAIHELDVVEAIVCALTTGVRGIFNVVGPGEVPL